MTKTKEDFYIEILQAYKDKEVVQFRYPKIAWTKVTDRHNWDFNNNEYRVPKPRRYYLTFDGDKLIKITDYDKLKPVSALEVILVEEVL